jgi:hypothetical protein
MRHLHRTFPLLMAAALVMACAPDAGDGGRAAAPPATAGTPDAAVEGRVAAHYFGRQWPKNFIAGFRREHVAEDFARIRADGFDTVVLLVSWGDFQPGMQPCCTWDERAFERLHFLLDRADEAGLKVMLRLGYAWFFHPDAGDVGDRQHRLMNDPEARASYQRFLERLAAELADKPQVVLAFMSWEDQWLHKVDESARADFQEYLATLPPDPGRGTHLPDATADAALFHGYWDWLVIEKLYRPAVKLFPGLSYEARIDRDPRYEPGPDGKPVVAEWIAHTGMTRLPPGHALTVYWAPFWGALNQGEKLTAEQSLALFDTLLGELGADGQRRLFVDQFNFVDNTPGHEHNAVLRPEEIHGFLHQSVCVMKARGVAGYALWTSQDYAENPLHNPAFGYGLEGWRLERAGGPPEAALEALPSGDFALALAAGDRLSQHVPAKRGRLMQAGDGISDQVCLEADATAPATLRVQAGQGAAVPLAFDGRGRQRACTAIEPVPVDGGLVFSVDVESGALRLRDVQLYDHVQYGGLYDLLGKPGPLHDSVRRMNRDFRAVPTPARCAAEGSAQGQRVQ